MFPRTIYAGSGAYLSLVGRLVVKEDHILIIGPAGEVRIDGSSDELRMVQDLIRGMNGFTPLSSLMREDSQTQEQQEAVLTALSRVGALLDRAEAWRWFHELSSNPSVVPMVDDHMTAYSLPRLAVSGIPYSADLDHLDQTPVDILSCARESADLRSIAVTPDASLNSAVRLATNAYLPRRDGRRPVASGGALYPLHLWVVGSNELATPRQVLSIDHDHRKVRKRGEIRLEDLRQMFVSDPDVATALDRGAAVIVIAADPRRITRKYGNRGWRYALIECGAVMHHIMLAATSHKEAVRPIGGYFDLLLQQAVCDQALPLLTFLVMVGQ